MTDADSANAGSLSRPDRLHHESEAAPLVRLAGWILLATMAGFIVNTVLSFWFGWPGALALFGPGAVAAPVLALAQVGIYAGLIAIATLHVMRNRTMSLRADARLVSDANRFFIRAAFWAVFLVGLVDAGVSFLRVEGLLESVVGNELARDLGRSQFRGLYVHTPLIVVGIVIAAFTRSLGVIWLALLVVVAELIIVFTRFVFSYEQAFMADLVRFWYGALFLFASAFTLLEDGHVRVDVFYAGFARRTKGMVNTWGSILLGMTLCWTILLLGMWTKSSIIISPILVFEVTQAGFGMYVKYFMAGFLGVFAVSMMVQFVSQMFDSVADMRDHPGSRLDAPHPASH